MKICRFCRGQGFIKQKNKTVICPQCKGKKSKVVAINYNICIYCGGTGWIIGCCGEKTIECICKGDTNGDTFKNDTR